MCRVMEAVYEWKEEKVRLSSLAHNLVAMLKKNNFEIDLLSMKLELLEQKVKGDIKHVTI